VPAFLLAPVYGWFTEGASPEEGQVAAAADRGMSEISDWLEGIGLAQYVGAFEANDIDMGLLPRSTTRC
jgi:hypothetical protein